VTRTLVLGGVRSGKSRWAERALADAAAVTYLATGRPSDDADWAERVALHQQRRPAHWRTLESLDLVRELSADDDAALLVEDLGNWVARTIDETNGWDDDLDAFRGASQRLVQAWRATNRRVILVSNEVGGGVHPESRAGRIFRDEVGRLNAEIAEHTEEVVLVIAGIPQWLRRPSGTDRTGETT